MTTEEQALNTIDRRERLRKSLLKLANPRLRLIVVLYMMGYTQREIAKGFEISQQRVAEVVKEYKHRNGLLYQ